MSKEALLSKLQDQEKYISQMEDKLKQTSNVGELTSLRESEEKLKLQQQESTRRENVLVMRLATKEQEMQELLTQIHDLKQSQNPAGEQLRSTLLDPAVNIVFQRMKTELDETKEKLEQAQNDLNAWKFTPDSVTGKKLMAKCRMLIQENQELGRQLSQGRVAQLEAELSLQKKYSEELKTSQDELNEFVIQLDEEVEGMQSTILALQQQLKGAKKELTEEKESNEKHVEQIGILKRSLDPVGAQLPTSVEGRKTFPRDGDSRRHMTDRTETEFEESGHEPMETDSSERGKENIKTGGIQFEYKASEPQVDDLGMDFNGEKFELDAGGSDIARPSGEHVILDSGDVVPAHENAHCNAESAVIGDSFSKTVAFESARSGMENDTTTSGTSSKYVQNSKLDAECQRTASEDDEEESKNDGLYNEQKRKGLRIIVENPKAITDQAKSNVERTRSSAENTRTGMKQADISTEHPRTVDHSVNTPFDVDPIPLDNGGAFCAPSEPGQRKAAGNVPCPTTFSISQILGEPRRTPSPDIPSGGLMQL